MPFVENSGGAGGGSGTVTSVTATDTSIVVAGTAAAPTIATGTLDAVAAAHPAAANWSNNSKKITGLANGTAATDAAALGQLPPSIGLQGLVSPLFGISSWSAGAGAVNTANHCFGVRVVMPISGTLHDLAIWVGTSSGNIEVGILDTTATTRGRSYTTGSIACPVSSSGVGWRVVGDPALAVTAGAEYDFYLGADNATATFLRLVAVPSIALSALLPSSYIPVAGGALPKLAWDFTGFPMTNGVAEASLTSAGNTIQPLIIGRIA
jgi:hypothetical protein